MVYLDKFKEHLTNRSLLLLVQLWEEYCLSESIDSKEFCLILQNIKSSSLANSMGCYILDGLLLWEQLPEGQAKDTSLKLICDIQTEDQPKLKKIVLDHLGRKYKTLPSFESNLKRLGLNNGGSFKSAISNFEILVNMKIGNFFFHTKGLGVGIVTDISQIRKQISLKFESIMDEKTLSFENALQYLVPINKEHFFARRFGENAKLQEFVLKNHIPTIKLMLADLGPMSAFDIREELYDIVIPVEKWNQWWQITRSKIKKDSYIKMAKNSKDKFDLYTQEVSHDTRLITKLQNCKTVKEFVGLIYKFTKDFTKTCKKSSFQKEISSTIEEYLKTDNISEKLQLLLVLKDIKDTKKYDEEIVNYINSYELSDLLKNVKIVALSKKILAIAKTQKENFEKEFIKLIESNPNPLLLEFLMESIYEKNVESFYDCTNKLLSNPTFSPSVIIWYFQKSILEKDKKYNQTFKSWESILILLAELERKNVEKVKIKKIVALITKDNFFHAREFFKSQTPNTVGEILLLCTKCQSFSDEKIKILYNLASVVHSKFGKMKSVETEKIIWTTKEGLSTLKKNIQYLSTTALVENTKEVEEARSHGDLKENSEYKFALEKRNKIQMELKNLTEQLKYIRVVTKDDISTDNVGIGSKVKLVHNEEEITYTLLGPFESDPDNNILSLYSRIGILLKNLKIGDSCTIHDKNWTIASLESVFD